MLARKHLAKWGFTPQKPIKKAWQQSDVKVRKGGLRERIS